MKDTRNRVVIGMDPHKRSVTIEVMAADETALGGGRFGTDRDGFAEMGRYVSQFPDHIWAVEGCNGIGRHVALRLLANNEEVIDVPPKLSARARVFATGQGRKTDATDAHSVALVGTRMSGLRPVVNDEQLAVLRLLVDRRRSLGESTPARPPKSMPCCWNSFPVARRRTCPRPKPRPCSPPSAHATSPARPGAASRLNWWRTSSGSMPARRPRTRNSMRWSPRPGPGCWS
jgi:hypothetical protein